MRKQINPKHSPYRPFAGLLVKEWRQTIEKKQTLKDDQFASSGHTFAKAQASDATKSLGDFFDVRKFIVPTFSNVNPGHGPDAMSHHHKLAEHGSEADGGATELVFIRSVQNDSCMLIS